MSSDIDIEEHDVMDHPSIKEIFPVLSWIKNEFIDLDDEASQPCENIKTVANSETCIKNNHQQNEPSEPLRDCEELIISDDETCLDVKKTHDSSIHEIPDSESEGHTDVEPKSLLTKNTIVLGSNIPNKMIIGSNAPKISHIAEDVSDSTKISVDSESRPDRDPFSAKVILKDWGYILEKHPYYCDKCLILFPSQSTLNTHTASEHSLLVPIDEINVEELGQKMLKCPICGYVFKLRRNYLTHIESKHDTNKLQPIYEVFDVKCMFCSGKYFNSIHHYCKHIPIFHADIYHKKYFEIEPTTNDGTPNARNAKLGRSNVARKSTTRDVKVKNVARKSTSNHTQLRHVVVKTEGSINKTEDGNLRNFICPICGIHCQHLGEYIAHCNTNHKAIYLPPKRHTFTGLCVCGFEARELNSFNNHISKEHECMFKKIATDLQEYYCHECDITLATLNSYNIHKTKHISDSDNDEIKRKSSKIEDFKESNTNSELDLNVGGKTVIIPKEIIFKCPQCELHSTSSRTIFYHSLQCTSAKSKVVCDICDRSIRYQDVDSHRLQHQLMPTMNAIEMTREAFYRLVLVCAECRVGFDGFTVNANHVAECQKKEGTLCQKCKLKIAPECLVRHEKIHSANGQPLVVEFICANVNALEENVNEKNCLYYCHACKSYDPAKHCDSHRSGACLQHKSFRICRFCGLRFSHEGFAEHILGHHNNSFNLIDIKFIDIHNHQVIKPQIPQWNKFEGDGKEKYSGTKRKRDNADEETVYCEECQENYFKNAYQIHLQYHEYKSTNHIDDEIMQKYLTMQSLWNIVYLCEGCNIAVDNYDLAVEHSQDHLTKNHRTPSERCTRCDLTFEQQSFERHNNLHNGAEIDKDYLRVLHFNYKNLLSKCWEKLFEAISDEQKSHILSKSVYDLDRVIRLELKYDGPATRTLYKCAVCDGIVDKKYLLDHAYNKDACKGQPKFSCSSCDLAFAAQDSLKEHHLHNLHANKSRIILFNKPKHFALNNDLIRQLRSSEPPKTKNNKCTSLSTAIFYECVDCGSGIQKLLNIKKHTCAHKHTATQQYVKCEICKLCYRQVALSSHMLFHKKLDKFYIAPFQNGDLVWRGQSKLVVFYECKECKICTLEKLPDHTCVPLSSRCVCNLCGLQFGQKSYPAHTTLHETLPNLARNNFIITQYSPHDYKPPTRKPLTKKSKSKNLKPLPDQVRPIIQDNPMARFLYKCTCNNLFVNWNMLRDHVGKCQMDGRVTKKCKCGLNFHASSLQDHLNVHFNCASIKSYLVASVIVGRSAIERSRNKWLCYCRASKTYYNNIKNLVYYLKRNQAGPSETCPACKIKISRDSFKHHMDLHREDKEFSFKQLHKLSLQMIDADNLRQANEPDDKKRPCLYKCEKCDVYFSSRFHLAGHQSSSRHDIKDRVQCNICNYFFPAINLARHKHNHHYKKKYKRHDFVIVTNGLTKAEEKQHIKNGGEKNQSKKMLKTIKRGNESKSKKDVLTIHRCGKCDLHFMLRKSVNQHLLNHSKSKKKIHTRYTCTTCGLAFLSRSLSRHVFVHHKTLDLRAQDFNVRVYTAPGTYTVTKIPVPPEPQPAISQPTNAYSETASQIFKCAECNVCFTNYEMCYDHTMNHKPLDSTEYIACNLCDFQFLCECLGVHRKGHREGTFNVDELIVKEFRPRDGAPLIKTYFSRELLEANVTSTTTSGG